MPGLDRRLLPRWIFYNNLSSRILFSRPRFSAFVMGLLVSLAVAPFATTLASPTMFKVAADQLTALEGTVLLKQVFGEEASQSAFKAHLVLIGAPAASDGAQSEVTVVRHVSLDDEDEDTEFGAVESYLVNSSDGRSQLALKGEAPYELEETLHMLNVHFPLEVLPLFALPTVGEEKTAKSTVDVLNLAEVEANVTVLARQDGDAVEIVRAMKEGEQPSFDFRGNATTLALYRVSYKFNSDTGALLSVAGDLAFEFSPEDTDGKVRVERQIRLTAQAGTQEWREAAKALSGVEAAFETRLPSSEIAKTLAKFSSTVAKTPLAPASAALNVRLAAFRDFFESSPQGKLLAKLLGASAPEFKLRGLDDKDVSFHAAIKDKVTLLSFWGVG